MLSELRVWASSRGQKGRTLNLSIFCFSGMCALSTSLPLNDQRRGCCCCYYYYYFFRCLLLMMRWFSLTLSTSTVYRVFMMGSTPRLIKPNWIFKKFSGRKTRDGGSHNWDRNYGHAQWIITYAPKLKVLTNFFWLVHRSLLIHWSYRPSKKCLFSYEKKEERN